MPAATILLVDDEPSIRQLMATALTRAGYRVLEARNGLEALTLFDATVDLLLTDMRMPYLGGEELIAELKRTRKTLKILSISGYPLAGPSDEHIRFLAKPFSQPELLAAVVKVLKGDE